MKKYEGVRISNGETNVLVSEVDDMGGGYLVEPRQLDPRLDIVNHSPTGFEWGYNGSGPAQLALAILADFTGLTPEPISYQRFKDQFIAPIKGKRWEIRGDQVERFVAEHGPKGEEAVA